MEITNEAVLVMPDFAVAVDHADAAFKACWSILIGLKLGKTKDSSQQNLLEFQPKLAYALFDLDVCYRNLSEYRDTLVAHKQDGQSPDNFLTLMRESAKGQEILRETASVGRSIGDAFAWIVYMNSQDMLVEHFKQQPVTQTPTGIGGVGELAFVSSMHSDTHFILYHGLTTFLRIGDVSFIDRETWRVTCLGELKTSAELETSAKVTLHLMGSTATQAPRIYYRENGPAITPKPKGGRRRIVNQQWLMREKRRLQRQMEEMSAALNEVQVQKLAMHNSYRFSELRPLEEEMRLRDGAFAKVGDGVLVTSLRLTSSDRLLDALTVDTPMDRVIDPVREIAKHALTILDPRRKSNRLETGKITTRVALGFLPLFWWGLGIDLLEDVYFKRVALMTLYNPAYFVDKLRFNGFDVQEIPKKNGVEVAVSKRKGDMIAEMENFSFFQRLISHHLMDEDVIVKKLIDLDERMYNIPNTKIQFTFAHKSIF